MHEQLAGYISGPVNAEDLAVAPGGQWVLTSGMTGPTAPLGHLYAVRVEDGASSEIFPYGASYALDTERFAAQPDLDPFRFRPQGIDVTVQRDGRTELYVVSHGAAESVEVFEVDLDEPRPTLRWLGGVALPGTAVGNDVAAVGDGFIVSTTGDPDGLRSISVEDAMAGRDTGGVLEWSPGAGWTTLPGTSMNTATGVAISSDGDWIYIGGWNSRCIRKVQRGTPDPISTTVEVGMMVDNLTWAASGHLLAAGTYGTSMQEFLASHFGPSPRLGFPSRVLRVDPDTLATETLVDYGPDTFGAATTALQVGREIWVGTARDQGLARFRFPAPNRAFGPQS
ncbi:hypothetical protein CQY20_11340 [Mycolicibacterium agri]|nr:hypothetical protein [Mycolicibacterium agri]PEG39136.1 hypothetical protein CQY20_11340 [Mycolicibacterium agri]